jgi:hypothetical protein
MKQLTLRVEDRLVAFLKQAASARGQSVNAYAQQVLGAAVDPDLAGDEAEQLRERLERAGLLDTPMTSGPYPRPDPVALAGARKRAARGRSLASFVIEDRS